MFGNLFYSSVISDYRDWLGFVEVVLEIRVAIEI